MNTMRRVVSSRFLPRCHSAAATSWVRLCSNSAGASTRPSSSLDADVDDFVLPPRFAPINPSDQRSGRAEEEQELGVKCDDLAPERESRLGVPLPPADDEEPLVRDGSRAASSAPPTAEEAAELLRHEVLIEERGAKGVASADGGTPLPFDDEKFAETILKMETEGVIDETWQDDRRARFEDAAEIVEVLRQMKVKDIAVIDTSAKTGSFDYMIFGTCEGGRHINLAAWAVQEADRYTRVSKVKRRKADDQWEPICIGRIVVNLMTATYRDSVNFERKWAVTKNQDALAAALAPVSEGRQVRVHGLWTLTLNLQDLEDFEVDYCKEFLLSQH